MATRLNREQLRKKAPKLVALIIAIALAALILLEVMQRYFVDSTPLSGDFLVASIVYVTEMYLCNGNFRIRRHFPINAA